jgi:hypothetical protein
MHRRVRLSLAMLAVAAAALAGSAPRAAANLVLNGSFEETDGTNIDEWVLVLGARPGEALTYGGGSPYGPQLLAFNSEPLDLAAGSATQDFGVTASGTTYLVSFAYAQFGGLANEQTLGVTINLTSVPAPQELFTDNAPTTDLSTGWKRGSFTFVGNGTLTGITFTDLVPLGGSDLLVDDVSIVAVPEANALMLLTAVTAAAGVLAGRRWRVGGSLKTEGGDGHSRSSRHIRSSRS